VREHAEQPAAPQDQPGVRHNSGLVARVASEPVAQPDLPLAIEDYALIGDCTTAALVGRDGSIDWLCWPRFDSDACFAALLGTAEHGRWLIAPADAGARRARRYRNHSLILETQFETNDGAATVIDFMPPRGHNSDIV